MPQRAFLRGSPLFVGGKMSIVRFYRDDPQAPKPNKPTRLGANVLITYNNMLLLEKRVDSDSWGLVGGGVKPHETPLEGITREVYEELGLRIPKTKFVKQKVYGEPGRIAAYQDGSIWRMVIVAYILALDTFPEMRISKESKELRFFTCEELRDINIVVTHKDVIEELFINK